jgi:hypothetical protein
MCECIVVILMIVITCMRIAVSSFGGEPGQVGEAESQEYQAGKLNASFSVVALVHAIALCRMRLPPMRSARPSPATYIRPHPLAEERVGVLSLRMRGGIAPLSYIDMAQRTAHSVQLFKSILTSRRSCRCLHQPAYAGTRTVVAQRTVEPSCLRQRLSPPEGR